MCVCVCYYMYTSSLSLSLNLSPDLCSRSYASPSSRTLGHGIPLTLFAGNICSVFMVSPLPPVVRVGVEGRLHMLYGIIR